MSDDTQQDPLGYGEDHPYPHLPLPLLCAIGLYCYHSMVSMAPEGGGVGPHVDNYDVFLVQVRRMRLTWNDDNDDDGDMDYDYQTAS